MALSAEEIRKLLWQIDATLSAQNLGAWEGRFLIDIRARLKTFGTDTRLSARQLAKLNERVRRRKSLSDSVPSSTFEPKGRWLVASLILVALLTVGILASGSQQKPTTSKGLLDEAWAPTPKDGLRISSNELSVVDGDTIRVAGDATTIRLVGFNTPETTEAKCAEELELGKRATVRLKRIVSTRDFKLQRVPCACSPGTEGTKACNHGRSCGILRVDGRNIGDLLIAEGLAVRFICRKTSCPPTPRPWCNSALKNQSDEQPIQLLQPATKQAECSIKGNINSKGERIYHVRGQRFYNATRIDISKGERWFCSETEARSASWRRSRV